MNRTGNPKIKICGTTSPEDAKICDKLGADYLGVIFADSLRRVTAERALDIRSAVPGINLVGVFANADMRVVGDIACLAGLDLIQLHGDESPGYCDRLMDLTRLPIIKVFTPGRLRGEIGLAAYKETDLFLFDLEKGSRCTNGAARIVWEEAARAGQQGYRIFLAGGLDPSNVREAVRQAAPFCVDVCRGVEGSPGVKDAQAVERFIGEVKA